MAQDEQMHTFVVGVADRRINLLLEFGILVNLKSVRNSILTLVQNIAFFKYQWCVFFHVLLSPALFAELVDYNASDFLDGLKLNTIKLLVHSDDLSRLLGYDIVELPGEVFRWEAEILCEYDVS